MGEWLDYLYNTAVDAIHLGANKIGIRYNSINFYLGEKLVVNTAKGVVQSSVSKVFSDKVIQQVDEDIAKNLKIFDPFSLDSVRYFDDLVENISQKNYKIFIHSLINKGVNFVESKVTQASLTYLVFPILASSMPKIIIGSLPSGIVASAAGLVASKAVFDSVKNSVFGGTLSECYKSGKYTVINPFKIKGISQSKLNSYPDVCGKISDRYFYMMECEHQIHVLYQKINVVLFDIQKNKLSSKKYKEFNKKYSSYLKQYKKVIKDYKASIDFTIEAYKSLDNIEQSGFVSKKMSGSLREWSINMKQNILLLDSNIEEFNNAKLDAIKTLENSCNQEKLSLEIEEKKSEEEMAYFYRDMNKKDFLVPRKNNNRKESRVEKIKLKNNKLINSKKNNKNKFGKEV